MVSLCQDVTFVTVIHKRAYKFYMIFM